MKTNYPTNPGSRAKLTTGHRKLGEVCDLYQPKTISKAEMVSDGQYKVYGANGVIGRYNKYNHEQSEILVTCRGATCGTVNVSEPKSWINGNAMVVRPKSEKEISKEYIYYLLKGGIDMSVAISGSAQPQITRTTLSPIKIPLPPIGEQKKIVAKLEGVLAKIKEAKKLRAEARKNTDNLLSAELHKIFTQQNSYSLIRANRRIVKKWEKKELGEVFILNYGKGLSRLERSESGEYIVYGANGELGRSDRYLIEGEGIIIGRKGSAGEITRVSGKYWPTDVTYFVSEDKKYDIGFAYYLFKFLNFPQYAVGVKPGINRNQIYEIKIPLPPLAEQKKIVSRLDSLSEKIRKIKNLQSATQNDFIALEQAVLSKSFSDK